MTVVAVALFETKKLMIADAKCNTALKDKNDTISRIIVKIHKVNDSPTFVAFMGDEQVVNAFSFLNLWLNNRNKSFDFNNKDHVNDLLQTTLFVREAAKAIHGDIKLEAPMIVVMNKHEAFYWNCRVHEDKYICDEFERIENNTLLIFYASERISLDVEEYESDNSRLRIIEAIEEIHKSRKSEGRSLNYDFDNYFTSVEIDNITSEVITQFPYDDLSRTIVGFVNSDIIEKSKIQSWSPNLENYK